MEEINLNDEQKQFILDEFNKETGEELKTFEELVNTGSNWNGTPFASVMYYSFGTDCPEEFEEGGRWTNWKTNVYNVGDRLFRITQEVPASEGQEGSGSLSSYTNEVKKVTETKVVTRYVRV